MPQSWGKMSMCTNLYPTKHAWTKKVPSWLSSTEREQWNLQLEAEKSQLLMWVAYSLLGTEEIFPVFTSDTQMLDQMWRLMCHFHEQSDRWDKAKFTLLALNTWSFAYKQSGKCLLWLSTQWPCSPWWTWWHVVPEGQHWLTRPMHSSEGTP